MSGHSAGISRRRRWNEAVGKPESWGVCESALKPRGVWEGSWRIGQGSKPDLRNSAVRDYRGASGNAARVELCTHLAYRMGEDGNPPPVHRRARALSRQPMPGGWEDLAGTNIAEKRITIRQTIRSRRMLTTNTSRTRSQLSVTKM